MPSKVTLRVTLELKLSPMQFSKAFLRASTELGRGERPKANIVATFSSSDIHTSPIPISRLVRWPPYNDQRRDQRNDQLLDQSDWPAADQSRDQQFDQFGDRMIDQRVDQSAGHLGSVAMISRGISWFDQRVISGAARWSLTRPY